MTERVWRVRPEARIREVVWDDEAVVFNCGSSHTHVLNMPVLAVIHRLTGGWRLMADILAAYRTALPEAAGADDVSPDLLISLLDELDRLGMIEAGQA